MNHSRVLGESTSLWLERLISINAPVETRGNVQQILASEVQRAFLPASKRGVAIPNAELSIFEVKDDRVRADLVIESQNLIFAASALCDSGASNQLTLPARKIVQLGLKPFGRPKLSIVSNNQCKLTLRFEPSLKVTLKFSRGGDVIEERTELLVASCHEDEYLQELALKASKQSQSVEDETNDESSTITKKRKGSDVSTSSTESSTASEGLGVKSLKLSPVLHRTKDRPLDRVVLGQKGLSMFHVHGNFTDQVLEIEEDYDYAAE